MENKKLDNEKEELINQLTTKISVVTSDEELFYPKEDLSILNRKRNNKGFISVTVISILLIIIAVVIFLVIKK